MAKGGGAVDVTRGVIWKQLLILCGPIFLTSLIQQGYALINTFIVGQFGGKDALGGIQATVTLTDLSIGLCMGLGAGCAVICGQRFGAHDGDGLARSIHTAMALAVIMGVVASIAGIALMPAVLALMGTPAELTAPALAYSRCYFGGMVFALVMNMGVALLRAVGDTRAPAMIVTAGCAVNAVLDLVFVALLGMGALGAGLGTSLTFAVNAALICRRMMRAPGAQRLHPSRVRLDPVLTRRMVACGVPLSIQSSAYSISNILLQSTVNGFGVDAVTGWGLSNRLCACVWMLTEALGVAAQTFSAQNYGARDYDRMRRGFHVSLGLSLAVTGTVSAVITVFAEPLARSFIGDAGVIAATVTMVRYIAPFYIFFSITDNASGVIRGAGESFMPMAITMGGTCVLRVAWLYTVVRIAGTLESMLLVYPFSWALTAALFIFYYRHGAWLRRP